MSQVEKKTYADELLRPFQRIAELVLKSREPLKPDDPLFQNHTATTTTDPVSKETEQPKPANEIDEAFNSAFHGTTIEPPSDPKKKKTIDQQFDDAITRRQ